MPIKPLPVPMVHASGSQVRDPPHPQKERQKQPIETSPISDPTGFQPPATAFAVQKCRLHTGTPRVFANPLAPGFPIRDEQPCVLVGRIPDGAELRLQGVVLPELHAPAPLLAGVSNHLSEW